MAGLLIASLVAILTTAGIVASLVFEAARFFTYVSPIDFLFGTHWSPPQGVSDTMGERFGAVPVTPNAVSTRAPRAASGWPRESAELRP